MTTSANHRELSREEAYSLKIMGDAWKNPEIPMRQWKAFENERILAAEGKAAQIPPFRAFLDAAHFINGRELNESLDILDVGSSSGYYGELLRMYGPEWYYTACDFNPGFQEIAKKFLPRVRFDVADARDLPYANKTFDVVVGEVSAVHPADWVQVINEYARVASKYVIFNRVWMTKEMQTKFISKTAYDCPVMETWVSAAEWAMLLQDSHLEPIQSFVVNPEYPVVTFVCAK